MGVMNFPPANHVPRGNATLQREDAVDPELWGPQTVIVVVIFGLVCVLHLTAFLYTVCLQSYVSAGVHTFPRHVRCRRGDKESHRFYGLVSPLFIDHKDAQQKETAPIMIHI